MSSVVIAGDTSGAITLAAPAVAGTNTITLPANSGTVLTTASTFAGTGPAFSAYSNSSQSLSAATITKGLFGTEEFDTNNNFASSRFTPTVAGYYQFSAGFQAATVASDLGVFLYKNGSAIKNISTSVNASVNWTYGSALIYCNGSTDYVEAYLYSALANTANPTQQSTYFQGFLARAA